MLDKLQKNLSVLRQQYRNWRLEVRSLNTRMVIALEDRDWREALHIGVGYLEETIDQMPRLWTYTWLPKWAAVVYLIFWWAPGA